MGGVRLWWCKWCWWWCLTAAASVTVTSGATGDSFYRQQKVAAPWSAAGEMQQNRHHHHRHLHLQQQQQQEEKQEGAVVAAVSARSSRLPWQQDHPSRQVRLPLLKDGETRFSFYVYGRNGLLQETTLSLHQVQAMLLECSPYRAMAGDNTRSSSEMDAAFSPGPHSLARPSSNIHGVVATVQQMVSSEAAQTQGSFSSSTPSTQKEASGESLEIPEDILHSIHNVPEHIATQWQFLSTFSPPAKTPITTTLHPTSVPPAATTTATPSGGPEVMKMHGDASETTQMPNRGNNRLPTWSSVQSETTDGGNEVTTQNLEATEDYHSSPEAQSVDTVIPSGSTVISEAPDTTESDVTDVSTDDTTLTPKSSTESEETKSEDIKQAAKTNEDTLLSTLTDFYAESYNSPPQLPSPVVHLLQTEEQKDESYTLSPAFLSTFIDYATSVLTSDSYFTSDPLPSSPTTLPAGTEPPHLTETLTTTSVPPSSLPTSPDEFSTGDGDETLTQSPPVVRFDSTVTREVPSEASTSVTISYDSDNLLSIDIIDPVESGNPYDVMPLEGQSGVYPLRSSTSGDKGNKVPSQPAAEPLNPYESPATLLQVLQSHNQLPARAEKQPEGEVVPPDEIQDTHDTSPPSNTNLPPADEDTDDGLFTDTLTQYYPTEGDAGQDTSVSTSQTAFQPSPSPAAAPPLSSTSDEAATHQDPSRSPPLPASAETSGSNSASSVLPPSQLAATGQQDKIDLEALQVNGDLTEGDTFYDYYGSSVYLDNVPEEYYNYDDLPSSQPQLNATDDLGFPGPNATSPHHHHHHHDDHDHHHGDHHGDHHDHHNHHHHHGAPPEPSANLLKAPEDNPGLEASVESLNTDIRQFVDVMNDITFMAYKRAAAQHKRQNFVMSPLNLVSTLGMLLLGTRGLSAGVLRDLLHMDKFYTFNPHLVLKNVTQALQNLKEVHDVTFFSQFLVDKDKNPYSTEFFAKAIKVFYDAEIDDVPVTDFDAFVREKVNSLVRQNTRNKTEGFIREEEPLFLTPPLSTVATSFLHARWSLPVTQEDLVDMNFIRFPTAERRLIQTTGLRKKVTVNAGFSRAAEATTAEVPLYSGSGLLSLVLVMPGEQKNFVANGLKRLEAGLSSAKWSQLLRSMLPNTVNLKMPVFRHRAFHNFSGILSDMGLEQLFQKDAADFSGINHIKNLYLNDVVQLTEFQSCQIEDPRTAAVLNGRRKRSPAPEGLTVDNEREFHRTNHPTYIYGLPMMEYVRERLTRMESGDRHSGETQKKGPQKVMTTRTMDGGTSDADMNTSANLRSSPDALKAEESPESVTSLLDTPPNALSYDTTSPGGDATATQNQDDEGATKEYGPTYPEYYYYNNYNYNNDYEYKEHMYDYDSDGHKGSGAATFTPDAGREDYMEEERVDRMGAAAADGPGAHYRQSDVGTLAFDRAFLYAVRHNPTGLLLYLGRYLDPQAN